MEHKKKYLGKLSFLFGLLFCLLLGFSSTTCYANVSEDFISFCIDKLHDDRLNFNSTQQRRINNLYNTSASRSYITDTLNQKLADNNFSNLTDYNCICFLENLYGSTDYLVFSFTNCSFPNGYEHLCYFDYDKTRYRGYEGYYPSNYGLIFRFELKNTSYNYTSLNFIAESYLNLISFNNTYQTSNDHTISINGFYNYAPTQSIYVSADSLNKYFLLSSPSNTYLNVYPPEPDPEPSGDVTPSGDNGGGGTVTPSGDSGSNIDYTPILGDINNNITSQGQNIVNQISGDTQKITNSIDNLNNTLTEQPNLNNTNITSGDIERRFRF